MNTLHRQRGFTLIELMVTTFIVAILAIVVIPGMGAFVKNERLTTQINSFLSHLQYARSEAILRHKQVVLCTSNDGASCSNGAWQDGWIVFFDEDADGQVNGTDEVLKWHDKLTGDNTLTSSGGSSMVYDYRGFTPNSNATFSLCDDRGVDFGLSFSISNTGRSTGVKEAASC